MKVSFDQDPDLNPDDIEVLIKAARLSPAVLQLLQQIQQLSDNRPTLPLTVGDRVVVLAVNDIVAIEVYGDELTVHTMTKVYTSRGQLKAIRAKLNPQLFIQVAKSTILNINYLTSLEASFSGNMTAFMSNQQKLTVSRKFLPDLKRLLGL